MPRKPAKSIKKNIPKVNKGLLLYNKIQKQFSKLNNQLPENQKLSYRERLTIISQSVYPAFKTLPKKKQTLKGINFKIEGIVDQIPPKEVCDVNYISPEVIAIVDWFSIDEYIETVLPDCIFVKVNAGNYGVTNIFNTRNYSYHKTGVRKIVDRLRKLANNTSQLDFTGYRKLRPRMANNGNPDHYYIEFILNINGKALRGADTEEVEYDLPKDKKAQKRVREVIMERLNELKVVKRKKTRARKTIKTNIDKLKKDARTEREAKKKSPEALRRAEAKKVADFNKANEAMDRDYKAGLLNAKQYKAAKAKLYKYLDK